MTKIRRIWAHYRFWRRRRQNLTLTRPKMALRAILGNGQNPKDFGHFHHILARRAKTLYPWDQNGPKGPFWPGKWPKSKGFWLFPSGFGPKGQNLVPCRAILSQNRRFWTKSQVLAQKATKPVIHRAKMARRVTLSFSKNFRKNRPKLAKIEDFAQIGTKPKFLYLFQVLAVKSPKLDIKKARLWPEGPRPDFLPKIAKIEGFAILVKSEGFCPSFGAEGSKTWYQTRFWLEGSTLGFF